jgi:hypothetical protein
MNKTKSEVEIACELVRHLDGLSIEAAKNALLRATQLLSSSQLVSAKNKEQSAVQDHYADRT